MPDDWKKETAHDVLALGGLPFYTIAFVRMLIAEEFSLLIPQLIIAFFGLFIFAKFIKSNHHIARGFILLVFTSLGYNDILYTVFGSILWICMIYSAYFLKMKNKELVNGVIAGIIITLVTHLIVTLLF